MKKTTLFFILITGLLPVVRSQSVGDSSQYLSFKENYNAHAAFVLGNQWSTSIGNQRIGRRWQNVADEFEVSPEGKAAFLLAQRQKRSVPVYFIGGYALMLGSLPLLAPSLFTSSGNSLETGIGIGMLAGGMALNAISNKKLAASADNFEKALWLRNRDDMLQHLSPTDQPRFRYLYESGTLYLTSRAYYKNGHRYQLGFLGNKGAEEFRDLPASWGLYKKYRTNQQLGALVYGVSLAAMLLSPAHGGGNAQWLYYGGLVGAGAGSGIMLSGRKFLRQAVYLRNYAVMERQLSFH